MPKAPQKASPVKVQVVIKGNLDQGKYAAALRRLARELVKTFGEKGKNWVLTESIGEPPSKGPRDITLYVVAGDEAPTDLWAAHGYKVPPAEMAKLQAAFDPSSKTAGATYRNVGIVPADKAIGLGEYGLSNSMTHEVGHSLIGVRCDHPSSEPECGGVMQEFPSPREDLGYNDQFTRTVREMYPLMVTERPSYTAVWQPSTEGEIQLYGWTTDALRAEYDKLWEQGWRLKLLSLF